MCSRSNAKDRDRKFSSSFSSQAKSTIFPIADPVECDGTRMTFTLKRRLQRYRYLVLDQTEVRVFIAFTILKNTLKYNLFLFGKKIYQVVIVIIIMHFQDFM